MFSRVDSGTKCLKRVNQYSVHEVPVWCFVFFFVLFCYYSSVTDKLFYKADFITSKEQSSLTRFIKSAIVW